MIYKVFGFDVTYFAFNSTDKCEMYYADCRCTNGAVDALFLGLYKKRNEELYYIHMSWYPACAYPSKHPGFFIQQRPDFFSYKCSSIKECEEDIKCQFNDWNNSFAKLEPLLLKEAL